jgi:hypothetical protein
MRKDYAPAKLSETLRPSKIEALENEPSDLSVNDIKEARPRQPLNTIPVSENDTSVATDIPQNDLTDQTFYSNNETLPTIESDTNFPIAADEPAIAEATAITEKINHVTNRPTINNKMNQIHITVHEEPKPHETQKKGAATNKNAPQISGPNGPIQSPVSESGRKQIAAAESAENELVSDATSQPKPDEVSISIAWQQAEWTDTNNRLEKRLEYFIDNYCRTYEERNYDKFVKYFSPTAQENGKAFSSLLPKYNQNFSSIDEIRYQIKLLKYSYDHNSGTVDFEGKFSLEWLPKGEDWRINFGKIAMVLIKQNDSFMVEKLDYYGY